MIRMSSGVEYYKVVSRLVHVGNGGYTLGQDDDIINIDARVWPKVLHRWPGVVYVSAATVSYHNTWTVIYRPGAWARPNVRGTKLFLFDNLCDAASFAAIGDCRDVWEVDVRGLSCGPSRILPQVCSRDWMKVWDTDGKYSVSNVLLLNRAMSVPPVTSVRPPSGTVLADSIKLIRLLQVHVTRDSDVHTVIFQRR